MYFSCFFFGKLTWMMFAMSVVTPAPVMVMGIAPNQCVHFETL